MFCFCRAIYGRIESSLQGLPPPFALNRPPAYLITSTEVRYPTKAPSFAVIWVYGDAKIEIVNTENGKLEGGGISKLCKNTLMLKYHNLAMNLPLANSLTNYQSKVYCEAKLANESYLVSGNSYMVKNTTWQRCKSRRLKGRRMLKISNIQDCSILNVLLFYRLRGKPCTSHSKRRDLAIG